MSIHLDLRARLASGFPVGVLGLFALLLASRTIVAQPFISEFMADNVTTLADEDQEFSDWIEVTNGGSEAIDLGGWYLTDDETNLSKWQFAPQTFLDGGDSLVVFASGKNRSAPNGQLHTNFALAREGEFLALIAPDGVTVASRFSPYPSQEPDISYGVGLGPSQVTTTLVAADAAAKLLVPAGAVSDDWRGGVPFNDAAWTPVQLGVGFNTEGGAVIGGGGGGATIIAYGAAPGTAGSQAFGGALGMDFAVLEPISVKELGVFDDGSDGLNRTITAQLWSRAEGGGGTVLASETFAPGSPGVLEAGHRFKPLAVSLALEPGAYTMVAYGYGSGEQNGNASGNGDFTTSDDGGGLIEFVGSSRFGATGGAWPDTEDGGGPARYGAGTFKYSSGGDTRIRSDLQAAMHDQNASAFLRIPFHYAGPERASALTLEIAYDDGFMLWLNGEQLLSRNSPPAPDWNSPASGPGNAVESITLPADALNIGDNVLAIQGMNLGADDSDFIIAPALEAEFARFERLYFSSPTPGQPNGRGNQGTGVVINEFHYDPASNTAPAEFVELYNAGSQSVDLSGWRLANAVEYTFRAGTFLEPDHYLVVALSSSFFAAEFSGIPVLAPFTGRLSNSGEAIELRDDLDALIDRVDYGTEAPWPVAGEEPYPSIQLMHPGEDNDLSGSWRAAPPTPGAINSVFAVDVPPQVRQVSHTPQVPASGEEVIVNCKVTDPDGVASVLLEYQAVRPGGYIRLTDAGFATNWTAVPMSLLPTGESVYQATLPGTLQVHRRLIRYRIVAEDTLGESVSVPLPGDPSVNFAYFVYDGAPAWRGAIIPGSTARLEFSEEVMNRLPIYHLIAKAEDVTACQYNTSFNDKVYRFEGALVYDGVVYDHMHYRIRGHGSTYNTGKNKWKLRFNRGRFFQRRDDYGRPYREKVRTLNWSALASPWNPANRGAAGLDEALAFRMWRMAGIPAANTNYFHLRIIDGVDEQSPSNQFEGDNWGLYVAIEQADRRFLDERGLPDGNTFNMHFGSSNIVNQAFGQPTNRSDLFEFTGTGTGGYNRNPVQIASWWERRVDLESYFSYRSIIEAVNHSDLRDQENSILYHNPAQRKWTMIPWDVDLLYEEFDRWGPNAVQSQATLEQFRKALTHPDINIRFQNRGRELQDLLLNSDQGWTLIDELTTVLGSDNGNLGMAELDAARWNKDPRTRRVEGSSPEGNRFFFMNPYQSTRFPQHSRTLISTDFPGMVDWVKQFIVPSGFGGGRLRDMVARDSAIPATPTIAYSGTEGFPTDGLTFASSAFVPGNGGAEFAAMEWRVGEIYNPGIANYLAGEPWRYELDTFWSSGELASFQPSFTFPPVAVEVGRTYRARARHKGVDGRWSHWSEPVEFATVDPNLQPYLDGLVISEIMYNPANDDQELEFLELRNIGVSALDLSDVRFTEGIEFAFAGSSITSLAVGETVLVVRNTAAFEAAYGAGHSIAGEYRLANSSNLANSGERITLVFGADSTIRDFVYDDELPWPTGPDGGGFSLVLIAPESNPDHSLASNWRSSTQVGGNPGASDARAFVGDPNSDLDLDGVIAFLEHALGTDPDTAEYGILPVAVIELIEVDGVFDSYLTIQSRRNLAADDVVLAAERSSDLVTWNSGAGFTVLVRETPHGDGTSTVVWRSAHPIASDPREFLRIVAMARSQ